MENGCAIISSVLGDGVNDINVIRIGLSECEITWLVYILYIHTFASEVMCINHDARSSSSLGRVCAAYDEHRTIHFFAHRSNVPQTAETCVGWICIYLFSLWPLTRTIRRTNHPRTFGAHKLGAHVSDFGERFLWGGWRFGWVDDVTEFDDRVGYELLSVEYERNVCHSVVIA